MYTYATTKLQPMITSEAGKALIQTCLAKDEQPAEPIVDIPTTTTTAAAAAVATTTLNNNDVIFIDENQRKKRTNISIDRKFRRFNRITSLILSFSNSTIHELIHYSSSDKTC